LLARLPLEFATLLAKDLLREWPLFVRDQDFKGFISANKEAFA
jgi:hypothetical protein